MKNNNILKNFKKPIAVSLAIANLFTFAPSSSATIVKLNSSGEIRLSNGKTITEPQLQKAIDVFYTLYDKFVKRYDPTEDSSNLLYKLTDSYFFQCRVAGFGGSMKKEDKKLLFVCCKCKEAEHICFLFATDDAIKDFQLFSQGGQYGCKKYTDWNILRPDFANGLVTENDLVLVISSENFWNETQNALNVEELKDYSGTDYKGQEHNQDQNVKANNFLQFITTEKIGSEQFDLVLDIKIQRKQQELQQKQQELQHSQQLQRSQQLQLSQQQQQFQQKRQQQLKQELQQLREQIQQLQQLHQLQQQQELHQQQLQELREQLQQQQELHQQQLQELREQIQQQQELHQQELHQQELQQLQQQQQPQQSTIINNNQPQ